MPGTVAAVRGRAFPVIDVMAMLQGHQGCTKSKYPLVHESCISPRQARIITGIRYRKSTALDAKKILIAIRPQDLELVSAALGSEFEAIVCHTLKEAEAALGPHVGMIACGVHFDSGAMFDLLRTAKARADTAQAPFYLLLGEGSAHSDAMLRGIRTAAKLLGAQGFTDLSRLRNDLGEQEAYNRLREGVRGALTSHS